MKIIIAVLLALVTIACTTQPEMRRSRTDRLLEQRAAPPRV